MEWKLHTNDIQELVIALIAYKADEKTEENTAAIFASRINRYGIW